MRVFAPCAFALCAVFACAASSGARAFPLPYQPPASPPADDAAPADAPPAEDAAAPVVDDAAPDATDPALGESTTTEEEVDFEEEEAKSDAESARIKSGASGGGAPQESSSGLKLFVDFLAISDLPSKSFVFRPNHTYVFVMAQVSEELQFIIHVDPNPIFFELEWNALPNLSFKVGKLLVPWGTNDFHHVIGGRVDEQSFFLPETWSDYGVALQHNALDTELLNIEYVLYAVNGSQGAVGPDAQSQVVPTIGAGASATDNNYWKALGGRAKLTLLSDYVVTPSFYYDVWDADDRYKLLFYGIGVEARRGFIPVPLLDRLRLRGEYARGEIELPFRNLQPGALSLLGDGYAVGRVGFYAEATYFVVDTVAVRARTGRINGNNTVLDDQDLYVIEPALLWTFAKGKVQATVAYQFLVRPEAPYDPLTPGDIVYGKLFLQF